MTPRRQPERIVIWAALLPILAVNAAYLLNILHGSEACFPYLEGCQSVSRGVRSGPGLWLFKALALPSALAMAASWRATGQWLGRVGAGTVRSRVAAVWLGTTGAVFLVVYALWLGTEGDWYRWLRRYGVVFYFAGTGLAQLVTLSLLWRIRAGGLPRKLRKAIERYGILVAAAWSFGVAAAFKRQLVDDPVFLDRLENALEWNFSLALSLAFLGLASILSRR